MAHEETNNSHQCYSDWLTMKGKHQNQFRCFLPTNSPQECTNNRHRCWSDQPTMKGFSGTLHLFLVRPSRRSGGCVFVGWDSSAPREGASECLSGPSPARVTRVLAVALPARRSPRGVPRAWVRTSCIRRVYIHYVNRCNQAKPNY